MTTRTNQRAELEFFVRAGIEACTPRRVLPPALPKEPPEGETIILGAGKAAAEMAAVAADNLSGRVRGCVVTRYGHGADRPTRDIDVIEAGHPVPDENSFTAAQKILETARSAKKTDRVLFMISGGGSALLCSPIDGVSLDEKQEITSFLVESGAPIEDINCVRKHLSKVKGGRLAAAAGAAEKITYIISDVVGDRPEDIASGPTIPIKPEPERALGLLRDYGWLLSSNLERAIRQVSKTPPAPHETHILARNKDALSSVESAARAKELRVYNLGDKVVGDAGEVGAAHARLALESIDEGKPALIISGGELTVRVRNPTGRGGPNLEYLAALMMELPDGAPVAAIACDSDGIDGSEDNAGGYFDRHSLARIKAAGFDPQKLRMENETYSLFGACDGLVKTGPTRTNVNDIRIISVNGDER
ncbi:MAG: glycerate kinase [Parvularculaceae bacterium]